jgi:predicted NBD/HSP70 family sugar kinase
MNQTELPTDPREVVISNLPEIQAQADIFTEASLHVRKLGEFDPSPDLLHDKVGQHVMAVDIGGDKVQAAEYEITSDNHLRLFSGLRSGSRKDGKDYLSVIESIADQAHADNLPVGISFAGPVEGTRPEDGPNVSNLMDELSNIYAGDFVGAQPDKDILLGDQLKVLANDAVAGLYAASVEAVRQNPQVKNVIYVIVGSGLGGAVLKDGQVYAAEPGHVQVTEGLNPYKRSESCGMFDQQFTCIEGAASGKAGIEATWESVTSEHLNGHQISEKAHNGDELANSLYVNSAKVITATVEGIARTMDLPLTGDNTAVVFHGGTFAVDIYRDRIELLLREDGIKAPVLYTQDFSENACLDGAALAAIMTK